MAATSKRDFFSLPRELRDEIYRLSFSIPEKDAVFELPCWLLITRGARALPFVNRQLRVETKKMLDIALATPCEHTNFTIQLPSHPQSIESYLSTHYTHTITNAQRGELRFLTKHLNVDAPDVVIVKPRLPKGSEIHIQGADEARTEQLMDWIGDTMLGVEGGTLRDDYVFGQNHVEREELDMMDILHICNGVRNAIRQPVEQEWSDEEVIED